MVPTALTAALCYGAADFFGGLAARRDSVVGVALVAHLAGLLALVLLGAVMGGTLTRADVAWSCAAGVAGGLSLPLVYRALALDDMSLAAPVTGVCMMGLPVLVALFLGERPTHLQNAGILLAVVAIVLVSRKPAAPVPDDSGSADASEPLGAAVPGSHAGLRASALGTAIAAGVVSGVFLVCVSRTSHAAGLWPLAIARFASFALLGAFALTARRETLRHRPPLQLSAGAGVLDAGGSLFFLLAARQGVLGISSTLTSLYPAATVVLARIVLRERTAPVQSIGIAVALLAILCLGAG